MINSLYDSLVIIFVGASVIATGALYLRQSLLIAYILLGVIVGPWGLKWLNDGLLVQEIGDFGIIFLLFLLGLNLDPRRLLHLFKETTLITLVSSLLFGAIGYGIAHLFGIPAREAFVVGVCMMFSSTILGLKLLPTTILHHQRMGESVIGILLLQDIIAIFMLLLLQEIAVYKGFSWEEGFKTLFALPILIIGSIAVGRYILSLLFRRFNRLQEFIFLVTIGWCLGVGALAHEMGLSFEIGAFIAGIVLSTSPIAQFISESLKPLRDFFLIFFFFSLGAGANLANLPVVAVPALCLGMAMLILKPFIFKQLIGSERYSNAQGWELGIRLGQLSEFSLLIAAYTQRSGFIGSQTAGLIEMVTLFSFMISSYVIVAYYPTPISTSQRLRRD